MTGKHLTVRDKRFVEIMVSTGDRVYAERQTDTPARGGYQILARPEVQNAIRQQQAARLYGDVLPAASDAHLEILRDKKAPAGARVSAIKLAYEYTLSDRQGGGVKDLHELTHGELQAAVDAIDKQIAAIKSKRVDDAIDVTPIDETGGIFD